MAVNERGHRGPVTEFEQWYVDYEPTGSRLGHLEFKNLAPCAMHMWRLFDDAKREMDARVENYDKLEMQADGEVVSKKADLPNISSGEVAGLVRRMARNLVQNAPNVEVISKFDDDSEKGIFVKYVLKSKIIGSDQYTNDMQQNLFASTKTSLTLGFDCVIPVLLQDGSGSWYMKYDTIHYRDVFPEPGVKDVREAPYVFVRRYLTKGDVHNLINMNQAGWDVNALKRLAENDPPAREMQSTPHQDKKHRQVPKGYEIITFYSNDGSDFLTFEATTKMLLRIEKNKHPMKEHPVHFLILEKDEQQPLGKSQVELVFGRQEFQDLMLNGAMKLWYRNINPSIIGYGAPNAVPNLSPGKYTQISNPNAKIEPFEVNTQTLMQYGTISEQNLGSMVNLVGAGDQQMAMQAGNGMSATPQGVEAQQALVDITTNNYQKAIESFFSHYCSYALTIFFQEMKAVKKVRLNADTRLQLLEAGYPAEDMDEDGEAIDIDFEELAVPYWVKCIPGSLTELEDEKQLRVLNQLFIPLSQAMPAIANSGDPNMLNQAVSAMSYIVGKQIELSGAAAAKDIGVLWNGGDVNEVKARDAKINEVEDRLNGLDADRELESAAMATAIQQLQENQALLTQNMQVLLEKLGAVNGASESSSATSPQTVPSVPEVAPEGSTVSPASA